MESFSPVTLTGLMILMIAGGRLSDKMISVNFSLAF